MQDPSGAIGAGVTKPVLEAEPDLAPGAVLFLRDVAVLRMVEQSYLAITPANVTKVAASRCNACMQGYLFAHAMRMR